MADFALRKKKIGLALGVNVLIFALVENALWLLGVQPHVELEDPFRGFSGLISVFERQGEFYRTRSNLLQRTFNDQWFLAEKPENGYRIFTMGGSSSFGFPWGASAAFTHVLGECLVQAHPEKAIEAVNASGVSYAIHRLNILGEELIKHEPDLFIIYSGHNEFVEVEFYESIKKVPEVQNKLVHGLLRTRTFTALYRAMNRTSGPESDSSAASAEVIRDQSRVFLPEEKRKVMEDYRTNLTRLVRRIQGVGADVVLCTVPCNLSEWAPSRSETSIVLGEDDRLDWIEARQAASEGFSLRNFEAALQACSKAEAFAPDYAETLFLKGQCLDALGRTSEAREAFSDACDNDASPTRRLSEINQAVRDVAGSEKAILLDVDELFEKLSPDGLVGFNLIEDYVHPTIEGHQEIAWNAFRLLEHRGFDGKSREADRRIFDSVVERLDIADSDQTPAWFYNQGVILRNQKQPALAKEKFRQALLLAPAYPGALYNLAQLEYNSRNLTAAKGYLERLLVGDGDPFNARIIYGDTLLGLREYQKAIDQYRLCLAAGQTTSRVHNNLGCALRDFGEDEAAQIEFKNVLALEPDHAQAHLNLGLLSVSKSDMESGIEHYKACINLAPGIPDAYNNLGMIYLQRKDYAAAVPLFERAIQLASNPKLPLYNLATLRVSQGRRVEAQQLFEKVLEFDPNFSLAHEQLRALSESN